MKSEDDPASHDPTSLEVAGVTARETELPAESRTSWPRPSQLTAMAAVIAAMVPLTAGVNGCFELQQQERFQRHEIRLKYLDRAIDPAQSPEYRERVLSFLIATLDDDDPMRTWASGESDILLEVLDLRDEVAAKERETAELRHEIETKVASSAAREQRLSQRLADLERDLATQRARLVEKERDARVSPVSVVSFGFGSRLPPARSTIVVSLPPERQRLVLMIPAPVGLGDSPTLVMEEGGGSMVIVKGAVRSTESGRVAVFSLTPDVLYPGSYSLTLSDADHPARPFASYKLVLRSADVD